MKPVIGVTPDFNAGDRREWGGKEPTYFLRARYVRAIEELGGVPVILPLVADRSARRRLLTASTGCCSREAAQILTRPSTENLNDTAFLSSPNGGPV